MGRFVNSTYITLDGVIEDPQDWPSLGSFSEGGNQIQTELLLASDAMLMGRRTYEGASSPSGRACRATRTAIASTRCPSTASRTLKDPSWNNTTVIDSELVDRVADLKARTAGNVIQYGFGAVSHALLQAGLIDELRLWLHLFVGRGGLHALIYHETLTATLELTDATSLDSGIVILSYATPTD